MAIDPTHRGKLLAAIHTPRPSNDIASLRPLEADKRLAMLKALNPELTTDIDSLATGVMDIANEIERLRNVLLGPDGPSKLTADETVTLAKFCTYLLAIAQTYLISRAVERA